MRDQGAADRELGAQVSAVLITRDAASTVGATLASLTGVVDEIVVHDTGSVDDTCGIAARAGARVSHGPWDDDFAGARNAAWRQVRTPWALSIDADEILVTQPGLALHQLLEGPASATAPQAYFVTIANLGVGPARSIGVGQDGISLGTDRLRWMSTEPAFEAAHRHEVLRLARTQSVLWQGRVHEGLVSAEPGELRLARMPEQLLHLRHDGYADLDRVLSKARRNGALSAVTEPGGLATGSGLRDRLHQACAHYVAGDLLLAAQGFREVILEGLGPRPLAPASGGHDSNVQAVAVAVDLSARIALNIGDLDDCRAQIELLGVLGVAPSYRDWLMARVELARGHAGEAISLLKAQGPLVDASGCDLGPVPRYLLRAQACHLAGDDEGAITSLIEVMVRFGQPAGHGETLMELWADRPVSDLADRLRAAAGADPARWAGLLREFDRVGARGRQLSQALAQVPSPTLGQAPSRTGAPAPAQAPGPVLAGEIAPVPPSQRHLTLTPGPVG